MKVGELFIQFRIPANLMRRRIKQMTHSKPISRFKLPGHSTTWLKAFGLLLLSLLMPILSINASEPLPKVMILGVFHFNNPGRDVYNIDTPDVLTPEKQAEIRAVTDSLAEFKPTKIAVELPPEHSDSINTLYQQYRKGKYNLMRTERQQLGFRLAHRLGHNHIHLIDFEMTLPFNRAFNHAKNQQSGFLEYREHWAKQYIEPLDSLQQSGTVIEVLRHMNDPERIRAGHEPYARMATIGGDTTYVGADLVARWYKRNLRIFANLEEILQPGDRVVVIFGAGHAKILREYVQYSPEMQFIDPLEYL